MEDSKKRRVKIWIDRAQYDWETATAMLEAGRYVYVAFMCQQVIEKKLKACIENNGITPPRVHNLMHLLKIAQNYDSVPSDIKDFFQELTSYYLDSRYKEDITKLSAFMDKKKAQEYLHRTKEVIEWLAQQMKF